MVPKPEWAVVLPKKKHVFLKLRKKIFEKFFRTSSGSLFCQNSNKIIRFFDQKIIQVFSVQFTEEDFKNLIFQGIGRLKLRFKIFAFSDL